MPKFVRDLMCEGKSVPLVPAGTKMSDAVLEISGKGFGCVGVIGGDGQLMGIITDGLRRQMGDTLLTARVEDVMTHGPKTIRPISSSARRSSFSTP